MSEDPKLNDSIQSITCDFVKRLSTNFLQNTTAFDRWEIKDYLLSYFPVSRLLNFEWRLVRILESQNMNTRSAQLYCCCCCCCSAGMLRRKRLTETRRLYSCWLATASSLRQPQCRYRNRVCLCFLPFSVPCYCALACISRQWTISELPVFDLINSQPTCTQFTPATPTRLNCEQGY